MTSKTRRWQFSLRELVALTLIVALALGYWRERSLHQHTAEQVDAILSMSHAYIWSSEPMEKYRSDITNIAVAGELFTAAQRDVDVRLQLISTETNTSIREANAVVRQQNSGRYPFHGKLVVCQH